MSTVFHGTYIGNDRMLIKTAWGMRLITSCSDMSLMPTLMVDGVIEASFTNWLIKNQERFQGKRIIDVGANIGYFTVLFGCIVGPNGSVFAYEANPKVYDFLKENIYLSQLQDRVLLLNRAVSSKYDNLVFHVSKRYQGNSSLKDHSAEYRKQFATDTFDTIYVPAEPLDCHQFDKDIELIKIDVEGAEYDVLSGAWELLKTGRVKNVMLELNKNMLGKDTGKLYDLLCRLNDEFGAMFYLLNPDGTERYAGLNDIFVNDYVDNILMKLP
jgi:FkbM family methyltransferase